MNPTNPTDPIRLWKKTQEEKHAHRETERLQTLERVVEALKEYFKNKDVDRAYLFGSVLKEGGFYEFSDIDIAVEGFPADYFATLRELEELVDRDVDLVEIDKSRLGDVDRSTWISLK